MMRISEKIRHLRQEYGWSQSELSRKARVPQTTISGIERDRHFPTLKHLFQIASAFGISLSELLKDVDDFERRG
ncbi:helix-turn-helix domain-containing protein [Alicyclobacillus acidocaldarius]|uniref:helix-turn-helix domain-containing protein n=1 Tax=Alicyclobacillus acidocaldarius TaxID=405212 RepID=UPI0009D75D1F